jgi:polyferredoxin
VRGLPKARLWILGVVNALILLHVVLYYAFDHTSVGCIDLFGFSTLVGRGLLTSGSVFFIVLILMTLVFGRVFCGWGCHFALFQDLTTKLLGRIGFRPTFRRSRLELVVPPILFALTMLYPVVAWWRERGRPTNLTADLSYPEVWHLLPGMKGIILILIVDVVLLTVLFGSRAFCRYVCPYGLLLKFFHVLAPFRIVKAAACEDCGACTQSCPAGVPIKLEVDRFGLIHDLNCMNCGDCVSSCPSGVLSLKPTRRAYMRPLAGGTKRFPMRPWVDATLVAFVVAGLFAYRGREFGDFLSAGFGLVVGGLVVATVSPSRLLPRPLSRRTLR